MTVVSASFGLTGRTVPVLFLGRASFRLAIQAGPLLLLPSWQAAGFGRFADAVGASVWLTFLAVSGEKAALKLVPRVRRLRAMVVRVVLGVAIGPVGVCAVVAATTESVLALACLWSAGLGLVQLVAALHRASAKPGWDAATFFVLAGLVLAGIALTYRLGWSPAGLLCFLTIAALGVATVGLIALPPDWLSRPGHDHRVAALVLRSCALLGLPELLTAASLSVCWLILAAGQQHAESARFYLMVMMSGICSAAVVYLLRLWQPATSLRLRALGGRRGRLLAGRVLIAAIAVGVLSVGVLLGTSGLVLAAAATVIEIVVFALVAFAGYLVENSDGRSLRISAGAAVTGSLGTVGTAVVLIPGLGAGGAMLSMALGLTATAVAMRLGLHIRGFR